MRLAAIVDLLPPAQGMEFDNNEPTYKIKNIYNIKVELQQSDY